MAERSRSRLALLAVTLPILALVALDLALGAFGWVPPDDPVLFFERSFEQEIDPFVPVAGAGVLEIRADWVNDGEGLRGRWGKRAGRQFLLPGFRPARIASPKPRGTLRVFVLGGSTSYGLFVGADAAFGAVLERGLQERAGDREVEVINLGCAGFDSDRVLALLPTVLRLEPDLVIVLTGHNEMLAGHEGPVSGLTGALALRARLLRTSTLFAWWNHLLANTLRGLESEQVREEIAAVEAGQIPTYVPEAVPASARNRTTLGFRRHAAERFGRNLDAMFSLAAEAGVPLLMAIPAANLLSPPGLSSHAPDFEGVAAFDESMRAGRALLESGRADHAMVRFTNAGRNSPQHAGAHFARAGAFLAMGRVNEARSIYRRAVDGDERAHRITSPLEKAMLEVLRARNARFVDLRPLFQTSLDPETTASLFVDHVHPTALGHTRIAEAMLSLAASQLGLPPHEPAGAPWSDPAAAAPSAPKRSSWVFQHPASGDARRSRSRASPTGRRHADPRRAAVRARGPVPVPRPDVRARTG